MSVEDILEAMENLLLDASRVPFTNKRVIEEDDIARLMDQLREQLPAELSEAKKIIADRKRILEEAQQEAKKIVEQAKAYGFKLTDESLIKRQAQEQANSIVNEAQKSAEALKADSVKYAADVFRYVENTLQSTLDVVKQGHVNLSKGDKQQAG